MKANWRKFNGDLIENEISREVERLIIREQKAGHNLKICIGTDSVVRDAAVYYATVIVFLREQKGGFMLVNKHVNKQNISLKERMITEVAKSVEIAYKLCPIFDRFKVELEVHADINTDANFKSNIALKEAMGYILGMGFQFKAKPNAFASSSCADRVIS